MNIRTSRSRRDALSWRICSLTLVSALASTPLAAQSRDSVAPMRIDRDGAIKEALAQFERAEGESLAVVDSLETGTVIGMLTEAHATRRYAEELDKASRGVLGEV